MTEPQDAPEIQDLVLEMMTGAEVERIRLVYKLSRSELAVMCGFPKTGVRIHNIEKKNSWKDGDREKVYQALTAIVAHPPRDKQGRLKGESGDERAARLDKMLHKRGSHVEDTIGPTFLNDDTDATDDLLVPVPESSSDHIENTHQLNDEHPPPPPSLADDECVLKSDPWRCVRDDDVHRATGHDRQLNQLIAQLTDRQLTPVDVRTSIAGITESDDVRLLTNSEVGVWQRCRRKWWLAIYRQLALKHQDYMGLRAVGNRVHRALAAWYVPDAQERTDPREALERAIVEDWTAIVTQERQRASYVDDEQSLGDLSARFNDAVALERAMVEGYMEWVIERGDDVNYRVTASETQISALVEGEVAGEKVSVRALALLDVRLTRVTDGVRLFEDHKTVGSLTEPRKTLHMDPQMLHYHLLEFLSTAEGEARCDGALYNMLRRVKRTARAKEPFYERVEVRHNAHEIDAYRRRLLGAARDIMRAERELNNGADPMSVAYPNPTHDCSWSCDFFGICPMFDDGSRVEDAITALYSPQDPIARYALTPGED